MAYREVTMIEVKEVLRLWFAGTATKRIAAMLGLDPKTVRRYLGIAREAGVVPGPEGVTDAAVTMVLLALHPPVVRPRGDSWALCEAQRKAIAEWLGKELRLTKIRKLLGRRGVAVPYATLHRFAVAELGFGRGGATVAIVDGEPGQEVQLDTGWVGWLRPAGARRRFRAWIFTAVRSRHRFVYPILRETTATAIEACEAAWAFFGGVFHVLIPDNTKAIVHTADDLEPHLVDAFLEYAQARGFHIDPTRVRHPKDKARVERAVPGVRDDCFAGEELIDLEAARAWGRLWCLEDYGQRRHSRTQRRPLEHFEAEERAVLWPAPSEPYDPPLWNSPKVGRDHYALVAAALYSLPTRWIGVRLRARADRATVRFYHQGVLIKTHPRCPPGGRSTHAEDFPAERTAYALRDITYLQTQANAHGDAVGRFVHALLDGPLPWTRMRRVYAVLGLARRYGSGRVNEACALALVAGMFDVHRLQRMLVLAVAAPPPAPAASTPAPSRFLRPATQYPARPRALDVHTRRRPRMTHDPIAPDLRTILRRLKLSRMLDTLPERLSLARQQQLAYQDFLLIVLGDEASRRDALTVTTRVQRARLDPGMQLEAWDATAKVTFDRPLLNEFASLRFLETHAHVTIVGPVGVGKTFLAHALGHAACRRGRSVLALRADRMLKTLKPARLDNTYEAELRKLLAVDLLILDDFALDTMDATESRDIYELLTERHRVGSIIATSNRGPDEWLATFSDPVRAQSAIDRFTSNAYDLVIEGESYRGRQKPGRHSGGPA